MANRVRSRAIPVKEMNPMGRQGFSYELVSWVCQADHVGSEKGGDNGDGDHDGI